MNPLLRGVAAGAAGTAALNATTYLDMAVRGRPASSIPQRAAGQAADTVGVDLGDDETASARRTAIGALLGVATGVSVAVAYAVVRERWRGLPSAVAGPVVGVAAMAASDVPMTVSGLSDPRSWGASGWLADLVPHLAYGVVVAVVEDALAA